VAIAVSGGVDSLTLASFAWTLRPALTVRMIFADGAAVPQAARARVHALAEEQGWPLQVIDAGELADPDYVKNPVNRCYFCKSHLFDATAVVTDAVVCTGTNVDDVADFRPGRSAAAERGIAEPFVEAQMRKSDVRALARALGLSTVAELPASPCLSSRIETGIHIDPAMLRAVDEVETAVRSAGAVVVRCRVRDSGVVVEHDGVLTDDDVIAVAGRLVAAYGLGLSVRAAPYRQGSAFLRVIP
jgi:uncharacterized protein